jgi:predicted transcriptional regulator
MSRSISIPDDLYQRVADLARRQHVSPERIASAAIAGQLAEWTRIEDMARRGDRERFLAALDQVPAADPDPADQIR